MKIPENLLCLFSATIDHDDDEAVIRIPKSEIDLGTIEDGNTYRVAIAAQPEQRPSRSPSSTSAGSRRPEPPVEEGEQRDVEIEDIGEQGDGIARVERGYVIVVPDAEVGERLTVEITDVKRNVAFAEIVKRYTVS